MEALTPYLANQRNQICIKLYTRVFKFLQNSTQRSGRDKAESDSAVFIPHDYAKSGFLVCIAHLVQLFYKRVFKKKKKLNSAGWVWHRGVWLYSVHRTDLCSILHKSITIFTKLNSTRSLTRLCSSHNLCRILLLSLYLLCLPGIFSCRNYLKIASHGYA